MNTIIYLICLINLLGIVLIVILIESHNRLHSKLKSIQECTQDIISIQTDVAPMHILSINAIYWLLWNLKNHIDGQRRTLASHEMYEDAEKLKNVSMRIDKLLNDFYKEASQKNEESK